MSSSSLFDLPWWIGKGGKERTNVFPSFSMGDCLYRVPDIHGYHWPDPDHRRCDLNLLTE